MEVASASMGGCSRGRVYGVDYGLHRPANYGVTVTYRRQPSMGVDCAQVGGGCLGWVEQPSMGVDCAQVGGGCLGWVEGAQVGGGSRGGLLGVRGVCAVLGGGVRGSRGG